MLRMKASKNFKPPAFVFLLLSLPRSAPARKIEARVKFKHLLKCYVNGNRLLLFKKFLHNQVFEVDRSVTLNATSGNKFLDFPLSFVENAFYVAWVAKF